MAKPQFSKLNSRVRFSHPAPPTGIRPLALGALNDLFNRFRDTKFYRP